MLNSLPLASNSHALNSGRRRDLSVSTRVDATGQVNLPLIGKVKILGLTVSEAQQIIEKTYQDQRFLRRPQVTVNILSIAQRQVSISGEVKATGPYPILAEIPMSVVDLVLKAGGFTPEANGTKVRITHITREGKPETREVDVKHIMDGTFKIKPDDAVLLLQPNDIVYVPMSLF